MATKRNPAPTRRTKLELSRLTVDQVKAELVALGIRPIEFVQYVEAIHAQPPHGLGVKLQAHERRRYDDHDALNHDPFLTESEPMATTTPVEKAFTTWHWQLWGHELEAHLEGLTVSAMRTLLAEAKDDENVSTPARQWGREDFKRFTSYLLANRDQREFESHRSSARAPRRRFEKANSTSTPTKRKVKKTNVKTREV